MGSTSTAKSRKKSVITSIQEIADFAINTINKFDGTANIELFTGYKISFVDSGIKVVKIENTQELISQPHGLFVSAQKVDRGKYYDVYLSLSAVLPISFDVIIDKDYKNFDYDYDNNFVEDQVCISKLIPNDPLLFEDCLNELLKECQRIVILYKDEARVNLAASKIN